MSTIEPSSQILFPGAMFKSHGGRFGYQVIGPCCRIFDRQELPWPSCSLNWKGKQPSWNRIGKRFVPDLAATRCPSYSVRGVDAYGAEWETVVTLYDEKLTPDLRQWWYTKKPTSAAFPQLPDSALSAFSEKSSGFSND